MSTAIGERIDLDPRLLGVCLGGLLNSLVVPRPIAWVSTRSRNGVDNLAPHSYFTGASVHPPVVQFTSLGAKDSLRNVCESGEFVVNVATYDLACAGNATATEYPSNARCSPSTVTDQRAGLHAASARSAP